MNIIYQDKRVLLAVKPAGIISTDVPGGMPELLREELSEPQGCVRPVHRLDAPVSGLMLFARSRVADSILSKQAAEGNLEKKYLAVTHGGFEERSGEMKDLLFYDRSLQKSRVVQSTGKDVKEARLSYEVLGEHEEMSLLRIRLHTGRTHQIRIQCSSRGHRIYGDKKYGEAEEGEIALFSYFIAFNHPESGERMEFKAFPEKNYPWSMFNIN